MDKNKGDSTTTTIVDGIAESSATPSGTADVSGAMQVYPGVVTDGRQATLHRRAPEIITSLKGVRYLSLWGPDLR